MRRIELAVDERIRVFLPILGLDDVALTRNRETHPRFPSGHGWRARERRRPGTRRRAASEDFCVDEVAAAALGPQVTLIDEQFVGERDGVAGDAELLRQHARRRQRHAGRDVPVEYRRDQHFANLCLQADLALEGELNQLVPHRCLRARHAKSEGCG